MKHRIESPRERYAPVGGFYFLTSFYFFIYFFVLGHPWDLALVILRQTTSAHDMYVFCKLFFSEDCQSVFPQILKREEDRMDEKGE